METSLHVPTRSLAVVCAAASSLGRINPKISADAVMTGKMKRFMMVLFLVVGGRRLALALERAFATGEAHHNSRLGIFVNRAVGQTLTSLGLVRRESIGSDAGDAQNGRDELARLVEERLEIYP
jgi:hypothetical protein